MASTITLKATGLNTSPNQLDLPEGSLVEAKNIVIQRDNIVEPIRGYKVFGTAMGGSNERAKQLFEYRERLFRHYSTTLQFQNGETNSGETNFTSFSESVTEAESGLRIKKVESNGNLYFTSSEGIKKISALNGAGLTSAQITNSGGIKAVDFVALLQVVDGDQSSFLPQDSAIAYRVVWGIKDANNNLILGTPSQREEVYNPMGPLLVRDFSRTLRGLDGVSYYSTISLIDDGNYVDTLKLPLTATAPEIYTNLLSLATKIDQDLLVAQETVTSAPLTIDPGSTVILSGVYTINFTSGNPMDYWAVGSKIYLNGFTPSAGTLNGIQTISAISPTSISINTTASTPVTLSGTSTIESGYFRNLAAPGQPGVPTSNQEYVALQNYLEAIILGLQILPTTGTPPMIVSAARIEWIDVLDLTKNAFVKINITVPEDITTDYFYQLYRSPIAQATDAVSLDDLVPSDELQLVYEAYPTAAQITAGEVIFDDVTPDEFRGANLYTNPATGEGIAQANDLPPYAKDINRFKNVVFFANTRTRHRLSLNLLGVQKIIEDFDNTLDPRFEIISGNVHNTYSFVKGEYETTDVTCDDATTLASSGPADYFLIYSANDETEYYVWYAIGTATDPAIAGKTGIKVELAGTELAADVASRTSSEIASYPWDFTSSVLVDVVTIVSTNFGATTDASDGGTGFTIVVTQQGVGEDAAQKQILLSSATSVALAVDETARSIVRVVNKNDDEVVYAYYLSGNNDVPGRMFFEAKTLDSEIFYILASSADVGSSFNPDISGDFEITNITVGTTSATVTVSGSLATVTNGDQVLLGLTDSIPITDGVFTLFNKSGSDFDIPLSAPITVAATFGVMIKQAFAVQSANETKVNRIYYSKFQQPEAVPIVNYFDVGDSDKQILRIFPLRDSLFVFKEEGLYRISGESAPFVLSLFDSSVQCTAPDTVDVANNQIYALTVQGVMTISEGDVNIMTRAIDNIILRIPVYADYKTLSFGVGYESDNSYTLWTVQSSTDETATIGYRYSNLTNSWTTVDREVTCGFANPVDDRLYYGAGDLNRLEQERKDFSRYDYSAREHALSLSNNKYFGNQLLLPNVSEIEEGDVIIQEQTVSCYNYNMLLKKLDIDPGVSDNDYYSELQAVGGDNMRTKLVALAEKLDLDPGVSSSNYAASIASESGTISSISLANPSVITTSGAHNLLSNRILNISGTNSTPSINGLWDITVTSSTTFTIGENVTLPGTAGNYTTQDLDFDDLKACFNIIIQKLNTDIGVSFSNYSPIENTTIQEAIVTSVSKNQKIVTLNLVLDFVVGEMTLFKAIDSAFTYGPNTFGNALTFKQIRECTLMFENKAFSTATVGFATDLLPEIVPQDFSGDGNGIFGHNSFGEGFFGGGSHAAPFRTLVPRPCQRCRYLSLRFNHKVAREYYRCFGATLTGEDTGSTRAYRG